ncbi:hypothetical protein C0993_009357 [Termitomyces sp. T159_Od127]|nr:hypothetical protein C0993_009357 [Termitomyces sp. T159_Od127]
MSSSCPPQLHLELPPSTTSFKRSFDQFGFDLDSPQPPDTAGPSASPANGNGNDRTKRARSASSAASVASSSSSTLASAMSADSAPAIAPAVAIARQPPRLPTPDIQDIDMPDYAPAPAPAAAPAAQPDGPYRLSLERFNAFDTQIAALRTAHGPGPSPRSTPPRSTPPPVLPPLDLAPAGPTHPAPLLSHASPSRARARETRDLDLDDTARGERPRCRVCAPADADADLDAAADADAEWDRSPRGGAPWAFWPPAEERGEGDEREEGAAAAAAADEEEEEEVQGVLAQHGSGEIWSSPVPPTLGALRSPSPLFRHLGDLDPAPPPPPAPRRREHEHEHEHEHDAPPPRLPPIGEQVLARAWDVPVEEMLDDVWSRFPRDRTVQQPAQAQQRPVSRERERTPAEDVSASATGSVSEVASPDPAPAPAFVAWLDQPWVFRGPAPEQEPPPSRRSVGAQGGAASDSASAHASSSASASHASHAPADPAPAPAQAPSVLDTYAASRLQALHGIGTALEGIGQVLRESELGLVSVPYLREGAGGAGGGEGRSGERTSAWRAVSGASAEGGRQRARAPLGLAVQRDYIELDWPIPGVDAGSLLREVEDQNEDGTVRERERERVARRLPTTPLETLLPESASESETESLRGVARRGHGHARGSSAATASLERLRQRAVALQAAVRGMGERWPEAGREEQGEEDRSASPPHVLARLAEPVEVFLSPWGEFCFFAWGGSGLMVCAENPAASSGRDRDRDRALPTNAAMLFDDGPSAPASFASESQGAADRAFVSGWRSVDPVIPRVREAPSRSPEREREVERERARLNERPWLRPPRASSGAGASALFPGTSLSALRARPYAGQAGTHAHPAPLGSAGAGPAESAADAQRRIARLGLIQMQRQRAGGGRTPAAESLFASASPAPAPALGSGSAPSAFGARPLPPRPRGFESFPPRSSSPDRNSYRARLAEQRARFDGIAPREGDETASLYSAAMDTLELVGARAERGVRGEGAERGSGSGMPGPGPGLRFVRRAYERAGGEMESGDAALFAATTTTRATTPPPPPVQGARRSRFPALDNLDRTIREEFLAVPALPSPGLEFEFASAVSASASASAAGGSGASEEEPHSDHRGFAARASHAATARRSPSPVLRRFDFDRSPTRRASPPYFDPEAFPPGPFRNTIQSFWSARNGRVGAGGHRSRVSSTREAQAQAQSARVTPPSLPPLAFEEEHRAQRPAGRAGGDFALYRSEIDETATAHLRAFLHRNPLPQPERPPTPQRFAEVLHQFDSPLDVLDRILIPQNNSTQSISSSAESSSDDRSNMFDATPDWLDGDNVSTRRHPTSSYRPPWRPLHAPRVAPNPPSDIHTLLNRLPRTEAIRRETSRRPPPVRASDDGFHHAIEALRTQYDASREPRTRASASASPWGILEQSQGSGFARRTNTGGEQANGELSAAAAAQRRRRHALPVRPDPFPAFPMMDIDDDVIDTATLLQDRARFLSRRVRGPGGEAPVFPRRIPTLMRSSNGIRRGRPLGDYIPDEDWNSDYESLLSLAAQLGEVKPRSTPAEVIDSMETGLYKDWKTTDSDHRCPICLDDVLLLVLFVVRPSSVLRAERLPTKLVQAKEEVPETGPRLVAGAKVKAKAQVLLAAQTAYHRFEGIGVSSEWIP